MKKIILIIIGISILLNCYLIYDRTQYKNLPMEIEFDSKGSVYGSGSMLPTIPYDATLYYKEVDNNTILEIGDIIVFENPDNPQSTVIHRIVYVFDNGTSYLTKGDSNTYIDSKLITRDKILKTVVTIEFK